MVTHAPDGEWFAASDSQGRLLVWDRTNTLVFERPAGPKGTASTLWATGLPTSRLLEARDGELVRIKPWTGSEVTVAEPPPLAAVDRSGRLRATRQGADSIEVLHTETGRVRRLWTLWPGWMATEDEPTPRVACGAGACAHLSWRSPDGDSEPVAHPSMANRRGLSQWGP